METAPYDRFNAIAHAKLDELLDVYRQLPAEPAEAGDRALYQRQSAGKALLTHIALLRKLLQRDMPAAAAAPDGALDIDGYRAMVAALDEGEDG
jgi:hypothetical protein